jgi:hypothetical protein
MLVFFVEIVTTIQRTSYGLSFRILHHAMRRSRSTLYASGPSGIGALEGAKPLQDINQVSHLDFKELMDEASTPTERGIEDWVGKRPRMHFNDFVKAWTMTERPQVLASLALPLMI